MPPLRLNLFSAERKERQGRLLANLHRVKEGSSTNKLLTRLAENEKVLKEVHALLQGDIRGEQRITPAGEWLLDNFYIVEEQIHTARVHLPRKYSRQLPTLTNTASAGFPRVYDLAMELIAHDDARIDLDSMDIVVSAYQSISPLKLGELWAVPIMLRLALIENVRRVAVLIANQRNDRALASDWADRMIKVSRTKPEDLILEVAEMAHSDPPLSCSFVAELVRRLHGLGPSLALPLTWIEQRLMDSGQSIEQLVRNENQFQATHQVSMSNSIGSLRSLDSIDWRDFVERESLVERTLREDPLGAYEQMDFASRDSYRHAVEKIAKIYGRPETEVAEAVIQLTRDVPPDHGDDEWLKHVGYYLIDEGRNRLEDTFSPGFSLPQWLASRSQTLRLMAYVGGIVILTAVLTAFGILMTDPADTPTWAVIITGALLAIGSSQLALSLINWFVGIIVRPRPLPRMDFAKAIPEDFRSMVVVPSMLVDSAHVDTLLKDLEVRYLGNRDERLHFALLTDFRDAATETLPEDAGLLQQVAQGIEALNRKYRPETGNGFFLFHRPRVWNPREGVWMGFERKRGKLGALNSLLRGVGDNVFSLIVGETDVLSSVRFVVTLDTDTQLSRDAARLLVATMAHPLNRPHFDADKRRVTRGYGILQPRVATTLEGTNRSRYARMNASDMGIDPYTRAVSDVYQDLFGEGSFIGKGIYDVDAFERAAEERFPDNRILSHDLLEGCYARSGLVSDVLFFEDYPPRYLQDVARRHRWIRGDWQIASWFLPWVPGRDGHAQPNELSALSRVKILDNLRRSLVATSLIGLLVLGWSVLPNPWFWTLSVFGIALIPTIVTITRCLLIRPENMSLGRHLGITAHQASLMTRQALFWLTTMPHEAVYSLDAAVRATWRVLISHRKLLEWHVASRAAALPASGLTHLILRLGIGPLLGLGVVAATLYFGALPVFWSALPLAALWIISPLVVWRLDGAPRDTNKALSADQTLYLRRIARKTWLFFETFVGPRDNWLPPDNFQEYPDNRTAHRTSPTNIGLSLLANMTALDFGYVPVGEMLGRTERTFRTMEAMERFDGHFLNWYDTETLKPLLPMYISTVDSGNLSGFLLTLQGGLAELAERPIIGPELFAGLRDTLSIALDIGTGDERNRNQNRQTEGLKRQLDDLIAAPPITLQGYRTALETLSADAARLAGATVLSAEEALDPDAPKPTPEKAFAYWMGAFMRQCIYFRKELAILTPWVDNPATRPFIKSVADLDRVPSLQELAGLEERAAALTAPRGDACPGDRAAFEQIRTQIIEGSQAAARRLSDIESLTSRAAALAQADYTFLYDENRHLLTIGYNVDDFRRDAGYYDLLASEARLASFVGIAQGQLPQDNWFTMGRLLAGTEGDPVLLSWGGSMFEYLMPLLVMPTYENTLLDETYNAVVERQIDYGKRRSVPWGISESGYYACDARLDYQYRSFGVPGLGLKRGLIDDLVIAPYATALAVMVSPRDACRNLERMAQQGFEGRYGFFEAIDFTPSRLPRGQNSAVVRSYMAHHQGMSLLAFAYQLLDRPMQRRFEAVPAFQATLLLLQERIPDVVTTFTHTMSATRATQSAEATESSLRIFDTPNTTTPQVQLLSNGNYHVMLTNSGSGYSRWRDLSVTRWREDATRDDWGTFCYIRDRETGAFWSTAYHPTALEVDHYDAIFSEGRVEFHTRAHDFDAHSDIVVSPEDDVELRRIRITNRSKTQREIDLTSYGEVVLAPALGDALHLAFSKLFVQTELLESHNAILATRRPRSEGETPPVMFHMMVVHGAEREAVSYETDRAAFIGRGRTLRNPLALQDHVTALSGSQGSVLDPIVSVRSHVSVEPQQSFIVDIVTGVSETREGALSLIEKYFQRTGADRVFDMAWTHAQVLLRQLNAEESDGRLYNRLAASILYANPALRAERSILVRNRKGQAGLWGYSISGDLPIVLVHIEDTANINLVRQLLQAHEYWRLKGLTVDLVIWSEDQGEYRQILHDEIVGLIGAMGETTRSEQPGGIYLRAADRIPEEDRTLMQTVARLTLSDRRGTLAEQIEGRPTRRPEVPVLIPKRGSRSGYARVIAPKPRRDLNYFNGLGGFTADGREYVITTAHNQATPAPWVNVLANPYFGTVISETGQAYTWGENAHEFRLTPWSNDPVTDSQGEAFYIRDEDSGVFWSPTPFPSAGSSPYVARHGFGYSIFEYSDNNIRSELTIFVALDASVKFAVLKLSNDSDRSRRLSATAYAELVLGDLREKTGTYVSTEIDRETGALFATNPYNTEFPERTVFMDVDDPMRTLTGDRTEFLGRNGTPASPAAMRRTHLSGAVGPATDPCGALQVSFELKEGESRTIIFRMGLGRDLSDARTLVNRFRGEGAAQAALENVWHTWSRRLGTVHVETPDPAFNALANGWLLYQTLGCRIWARTATYQSGGAFGFRDQLQDAMALLHADPALLRSHLLLCASRQYPEGDVQHWWHPPLGRGVRTQCSDDYLWLPLATCRYVFATDDSGVLDEVVPFIEGRRLRPDEESYYDLATVSDQAATLYEHCVRSIENGLRFGEHGLPLMGSGDWNDGMDRVGREGKGESVWLGFFLYQVLTQFAELARWKGDFVYADVCLREAASVQEALERHGWDGEWYRRAYFDDGTPLGSQTNTECRIDAVAQSWSVLSGAADPERASRAMQALDEHLVDRNSRLIRLLRPAFDGNGPNPGYIRGYVPGVRENGGQYTHAAVWATMAFAKMGNADKAWELFNLINPVNHGRTPEDCATYKVEPYVVSADVYTEHSHAGRGGWSWYTGSSAWMYRLMTEWLLGLTLEHCKLRFQPLIPKDWNGFKVHYQYQNTVYHIDVMRTEGDVAGIYVFLDGGEVPDALLPLTDDGVEHAVEVHLVSSP